MASRMNIARPQDYAADRATIMRAVRAKTYVLAGIAVAVITYLSYAWVAFGVSDLIERARPARAMLVATDAVKYKVHVAKSLRRGALEIAVEGERTATYKTPPQWVRVVGEQDAVIDLGDGYRVEIEGRIVRFTVPDYGVVVIEATADAVVAALPPGEVPEWVRAIEAKFDARPDIDRRVQVSRAKIEVHRYFFGWENFFFPFDSDLTPYTARQIFDLVVSGQPRLHKGMSNFDYVFDTFWRNPDWQHGEMFVALLETLLMAVLGTFTAAFLGLPLAFLAAGNFTPSWVLRFFIRRLFDLLRGIDYLIWSLILIRSFGLGPLTGVLAIGLTDTGSLGKLFSEALENIDRRQVEGVSATGASKLQLYRYGVIPQILPIFLSQGLYYLESNTRSATIIGALGAGGIGLLLVETLRTSRDWENTLYIVVLTVMLVILMDNFSSWLRRRLIEGKAGRRLEKPRATAPPNP